MFESLIIKFLLHNMSLSMNSQVCDNHLINRSKATFTKLRVNGEIIGGVGYCFEGEQRQVPILPFIFIASKIFRLKSYYACNLRITRI